MTRSVARAEFPAMSTTVAITGVGVSEAEVAAAAALGGRLAEDWERRFSRFRSDSQLSRLNAEDGRPLRVDDTFLNLLERAKLAVRRTGGRFDPSVLPALEAAGYNRSIERIRTAGTVIANEPRPAAGVAGWDLVCIDRDRGEVTLPLGMKIDLGGVAKGAFADHLANALLGWPGGCVDAGGDLRLWGEPPGDDCWSIGIENPFRPERDLVTAEIQAPGMGVATSGTHRRRWQVENRSAHHLIDPRRGVPAADVIRSVTAFAPDTATADIAAKALLIAAAEGDFADTFGATRVVIATADGQTIALAKEDADGIGYSGIALTFFVA